MGTTGFAIDRQGRIVVPLAERQRLGLMGWEELVLIPASEGPVVEWRRDAGVSAGLDGLPLVDFVVARSVSGDEALAALRAHRDER